MTTTTDQRTVPIGYIAPGASKVNIPAAAPPAPPNQAQLRHQLFEELAAAGHEPQEIRYLFNVLGQLKNAVQRRDPRSRYVDPDTGVTVYTVPMDMAAHDVLDGVMDDQQLAAPDSVHERINAAFLPEGWTAIHDRHAACSLDAMRLDDARRQFAPA